MIYSQAVLEHVDDLPQIYKVLYRWLNLDGFMSHEIGFESHGLSKHWNGHWAYSDFTWKLIRGKRPYLLNREPYSTHNRLLKESGFEIVHESKHRPDTLGISRNRLSSRFRKMSEDDMRTYSAYILAQKKPMVKTNSVTSV